MNFRLPLVGAALALALNSFAQEEDPTILAIIESSDDHTTLATAINEADLTLAIEELDGASVFAPTNAAFDALPDGTLDMLLADPVALQQVLLYHVIDTALGEEYPDLGFFATLDSSGHSIQLYTGADGGGDSDDSDDNDERLVNDSTAVTTIEASNGAVYSVGAVLMPRSITATAVQSPVHNTLETAVGAAGVATTLDTTSGLTVFAPVDAAFAALPDGVLDSLLEDDGDMDLANVLTYHVVPAVLDAEAVVAAAPTSVATLQGDTIDVAVVDGGVVLNETVNVVITDIVATNGIVHVIDAVLIPMAADTTDSSIEVLSATEVGISIFPVPARGTTTVSLPDALARGTQFAILDAAGKQYGRRLLNDVATTIDVSALPTGTYYFRFDAADGRSFVQPVAIQQ